MTGFMAVWFQTLLPTLVALLGALVGFGMLGYRARGTAPPSRDARYRTGQALAITSGVIVEVLLMVMLYFNPYNSQGVPLQTIGRMLPTAGAAVVACIAGVRGSSGLLVVSFSLGFFPWWIGPYLLGTPGVFRWIPVAQFGYLAAAWLLAWRRVPRAA